MANTLKTIKPSSVFSGILLILVTLAIFLPSLTFASPTATTSPTATSSANRARNEILQRLLALSAETPRQTYTGKIKTITNTSLIITSPYGDKTITTTNATSFYRFRANTRSEINLSNLKVGDDLAAIGAIDPVSAHMTAFQIIAKTRRYNLIGIIESAENGIISLKEFGGGTSRINLNETPILKKNVGTIFTTANLSDFKPGTVASIICYTDPADNYTLSSLRATVVNY